MITEMGVSSVSLDYVDVRHPVVGQYTSATQDTPHTTQSHDNPALAPIDRRLLRAVRTDGRSWRAYCCWWRGATGCVGGLRL
eukprot:COSAG01_NODE_4258_length_5201_cov_4.634065_3_plen_82_part_00